MPLPGHQNGHSTYRLALTLSVAFLLHILILAAVLHNWLIQPEPEPTRVHFTLLAESQESSAANQQSQSSKASAAANDASPAEAPPQTSPEIPVITRPAERAVPEESSNQAPDQAKQKASEAPSSKAAEPSPSPSPSRSPQSVASPNATSSQRRSAGSPVEMPEPIVDQPITQISQEKAPQDPYISLLWQHISKELDSRPVRSIHDLKRVRTVRLELHLMENGALRRVDTIESSGKPTLDQAARQSALAASPYPEPPESAREQGYRFQVELRFTPRPGD